jgi:hypothetical protein
MLLLFESRFAFTARQILCIIVFSAFSLFILTSISRVIEFRVSEIFPPIIAQMSWLAHMGTLGHAE